MFIMNPQLIQTIKSILWSRNALAGFKGLLVYIIFFVIFFLGPFERLFSLPAAGTSALLFCIAGFPGKSVGACITLVISALLGVGLGAFNFYLLAKAAPSPVGQGFLFFIMVYLLGLLKASDPKWFAFSLLCILMSWNGITTTVNAPGRQFSSDSLISYLTAYLWGGAIILFVNIFVFPHTAEKELRIALAASLDHCRVFFCLLSKTYRLEINEEETRVRDELAQSIRADFNILQGIMTETRIEIVWSKWSMSDYNLMVHKTRTIQQILTTVHTNLQSLDGLNTKEFKRDFLLGADKSLDELQKTMHQSLQEIQKELGVGDQCESFNQKEAQDMREVDLENSSPSDTRPQRNRSSSQSTSIMEVEARLRSVQNNLANELNMSSRNSYSIETLASADSIRNSNPEHDIPMSHKSYTDSTPGFPSTELKKEQIPSSLQGKLLKASSMFEEFQYRKIGVFLGSGRLYDSSETMLLKPSSSVLSMSGPKSSTDIQEAELEHETNKTSSHPISFVRKTNPHDPNSHLSTPALGSRPTSNQTFLTEIEETEIHQTFLRAFSYSFSIHNLIKEVTELLEHVTENLPNGSKRKSSLHFHFLENLNPKVQKRKPTNPNDDNETGSNVNPSSTEESEDEKGNLSMREALDALEGREHIPSKRGVLGWLIRLEDYIRSPDSICAFKGACGASVLGILFWVDKTRRFSTDFTLSSGLLTIMVAITPTLGQSWMSFMFQICGQGLGLVYTMIDVGGYKYNPYGLVVALSLFAAPLCYMLYSDPKLFILCLLALNSAGVLAYSEFLNRNHTFDSPAHRMGKILTALAVALAIVTSLQLLILRNPAKRSLRKAMAQVMKANTAYTIILQAYVKATVSTDPYRRPSHKALRRVYHELIKRETQIQSQILNLIPLIKFSSVEPSFVKPFNGKQYSRLVKANQRILDRNRDARMAIGDQPISEIIIKEFVNKLHSHRKRAIPELRVSFYLCTSTLQSKFPLPKNLPKGKDHSIEFFHDGLLLSIRLIQKFSKSKTRSDESKILTNRELTRYWSYLLSMISIFEQLEEIENATQILFGNMEDDPLDF
ncbi:uncharacterized protein MELLADRAFT_90177 [Melampsora larici-populina 98AG31]|uniref:Uncharacterized protein n=1 Tax=Melampsora larici-populina (strain 98AG31 / pathotype 3-4-7) TaxID=747676 RepID=F4RW01_MELLP|nr:uncharacterized protein MELLADRAFT_90177 [Melampsora larici-populina 98AG31]EGG03448.1 hypothetical protein MELLADRAFT_90177 [Melampsora larici-populina 98AG31]